MGQGCGGRGELAWGLAIGSAGGSDSHWSTRKWEPGKAWVGLSNRRGRDPFWAWGAAGSQPSEGPVSPQDEMRMQWLGQCLWPGRGAQAGNVAGIITGRGKARRGQGLQRTMCSGCSPAGTDSEPRAVAAGRGSLRTMHGGGSAPSCCAFILCSGSMGARSAGLWTTRAPSSRN